MQKPPLTNDEPFRLAEVARANILDTPIDPRFERITRLAKRAFNVPIVAVSIVDSDRQWFKSEIGLSCKQTSRDISFCSHNLDTEDFLVIPNAKTDPRFYDNPLVTEPPHVVFYAGVIIRSDQGAPIGRFCVIDHKPRVLTPDDLECLRDFGVMVETEIHKTSVSNTQITLISQIPEHRRRSMIDPVTGVWNATGINYMFSGQINQFFNDEDPFALMTLRIANSNNYPEQSHDHVSREVARRIINSVRNIDQVGRIDDNTFLILMNSVCRKKEAAALANQINNAIHDQLIQLEDDTFDDIHTHAGLTLCNSSEVAATDRLLATARVAMNDAAQEGINRIAFKPTVPNQTVCQ